MAVDTEEVVKAIVVLNNHGIDVTLTPCPFTGAPSNTFSHKNLPTIKSPFPPLFEGVVGVFLLPPNL